MVWVKTKQTFAENLAQMPETDEVEQIIIQEPERRAGFNHQCLGKWLLGKWLGKSKNQNQNQNQGERKLPHRHRAQITHQDPDLLRLFYYLATTMGELNHASAQRAYELLADHAAAAQSHPSQHPALSILLEVASTAQTYEIKVMFKPKEETVH